MTRSASPRPGAGRRVRGSGGLVARVVAAAGALVVAGVLALAPAASASAHDYLVASTPKSGSTITAPPKKIVLTFDDRVLDLSGDGSSNVVEVTSGAKHYETGCPVIADTNVTVPVSLGDSGKYTVTWQIVSADGHVVSASISFTYDRPQDAPAAAGKPSRPACGDQATSGSGSSAAGSSGSGSSSGSASTSASSSSALPIALGVGGGIIVVALVAVVLVLRRSRAADAAGAGARTESDGHGESGQRAQPRRAPRSRRQPPPPPGD
ncbi:copper resistance CopC family protein [Frondihabitans australicus]|uniref:CopC domain-containing protein n=1 Tax=Frondihabitans australicus TaxID=386892 RepID=A0A495IJM6_9MICO|nr:copper resistance CopC family protein [Frondihabitans australicus]RKR76163.1 hypothetical protein C8E83_3328 [Frondihabitans australicus]